MVKSQSSALTNQHITPTPPAAYRRCVNAECGTRPGLHPTTHPPTLARDDTLPRAASHIVQVISGTESSLSFNTSCRHHITYVPGP
jgi:hypothetical protein